MPRKALKSNALPSLSEIHNNFIFEFVFWTWSLMEHASGHVHIQFSLMMGSQPPAPFPTPWPLPHSTHGYNKVRVTEGPVFYCCPPFSAASRHQYEKGQGPFNISGWGQTLVILTQAGSTMTCPVKDFMGTSWPCWSRQQLVLAEGLQYLETTHLSWVLGLAW
jgi:hypothetical protein